MNTFVLSYLKFDFLFFFLKEQTTRNIHNLNAVDLADCISLLNAGIRYVLRRHQNSSLTFIFFRSFEAIASPLDFESRWRQRYSTASCSLMQ